MHSRLLLRMACALGAWWCLGCGGRETGRSSAGLKVVLLGIDAATWDIGTPLIDRGLLPHFRLLRDGGATGVLVAREPTWSPAVWTSIATGVLRQRHGITDFVTEGRDGGRVPFTSNQRRRKAVWNILSEAGKTVGVVNWWVSYPAEPVNGFVVSNYWRYFYHRMLALGETDGRLLDGIADAVYPADLAGEIAGAAAEAAPPWDVIDSATLQRHEVNGAVDPSFGLHFARDAAIFSLILHRDSIVQTAAERLFRKRLPDFFAVYFEGVDAACHLFWPYSHPAEFRVTEEEARDLGGVIDSCYVIADRIVGHYMACIDSSTVLIVCSDHGYGSLGEGTHFHVPEGLIAFWGAPVRRGVRVPDIHDEDVTPTILALMGLPRADDMDGSGARGVLTPRHASVMPAHTIPTYERHARPPGEPLASPIDDDIMAQLKALGYLEAEAPTPQQAPQGRTLPVAPRRRSR